MKKIEEYAVRRAVDDRRVNVFAGTRTTREKLSCGHVLVFEGAIEFLPARFCAVCTVHEVLAEASKICREAQAAGT